MFCGFFFSGKTNNVWPSCLHLTMGSGEVVVFLSFPLDFAFTSSQRAPKNFQPIRLQLSSPCFSTNPPPPSFPYLVYFSRNIFFRARLIRENEGRKETGEKKGWEEEVATVQWPPSYPTTSPSPVFFSQKTNSKKKRRNCKPKTSPWIFTAVCLCFPYIFLEKRFFLFFFSFSVCGQLPSVVTLATFFLFADRWKSPPSFLYPPKVENDSRRESWRRRKRKRKEKKRNWAREGGGGERGGRGLVTAVRLSAHFMTSHIYKLGKMHIFLKKILCVLC